MKNIAIILDPPHGVDVSGKQSPDGTHKEYAWGRDRCNGILKKAHRKGFPAMLTNETDYEIGLTRRKNFANEVSTSKKKILLSLHNDAKGNGSDWMDARGFSVWTTKGVTKSDDIADVIFETLKKNFPEIRARQYGVKKGEKDFESNFTVLTGATYYAVLIEWLFQDNRQDVALLADADYNERFEDAIIEALELIDSIM